MNVLFHTTAALGIAVMLTDTNKLSNSSKTQLTLGTTAFLIGVISHGALDYIPHCYPINSKFDVIGGLIMIIGLTTLSNQKYRAIIGLSFLGSIFPDLIDLGPQVLNNYLGISMPNFDKVFPWHWEKYSGSIFIDDCRISALNHLILVTVVIVTCICRKTDFNRIFNIKKD